MRLTLAEYAAANADGTYTLLRGGMSRFWGDLPLQVRGFLALSAEDGEVKSSDDKISLRITKGPALIFDATVLLKHAGEPQSVFVAVPAQLGLLEYGEYLAVATIGGRTAEFKFQCARQQ